MLERKYEYAKRQKNENDAIIASLNGFNNANSMRASSQFAHIKQRYVLIYERMHGTIKEISTVHEDTKSVTFNGVSFPIETPKQRENMRRAALYLSNKLKSK
jgi:hypothetical protein